MNERPTGTVSFLFTDVEGSTRLWEEQPVSARAAMALHDELLRAAIERHRGSVFSTAGDAFAAAFWTPMDALDAAVVAQRDLSRAPWPTGAALAVRMAVHTGTADERDGDYFGPTLNRAARLMSAAHGGQIVVSASTQRLVGPGGSGSWAMTELGTFRLKDLSAPETVYQVTAEGLASSFPPLRSLSVGPHNLPLQTTTFMGRGALVARVGELLGSQRLVTLVGGGGFGKTRTALRAAAEVADRFDGVFFVELAPLRDPGQVVARVIESMGHAPSGMSADGVDRTMVDRVGERSALLLVDNCEHLVDECARVIQLLLTRCPNMRVLATSRQPLGLPGERLQSLTGLGCPSPGATPAEVAQSEAGALFLERARAVRPDFDVNASNAAAVSRICRQVDGLPLALELAAARVRAMAPADIAERISRSLHVLAGSGRVGEERHRTLDACLAWSFDALAPGAAAVLRCLSVFAGGATLEACGAVCAGDDLDVVEVEDHLVTLVDRSLVQLEDRPDGARYRLHELVRQFAGFRLVAAGEADVARNRHLAWSVDIVRRCSPGLRSLTTLESVEPLLADADNLAVAVAWAMEQKDAVALARLLGGGGEMWAHVNKMRQLGDWWKATLPLLPEAPDTTFSANRLGLSLISASAALGNNGRYAEALDLLERALRLPELSEEAAGFGRWLQLSWRLSGGSDPLSLRAPFELLVDHASAHRLAVEAASRHQLALIDCLTGAPEDAIGVLEPIFEHASPTTIAMLGPTTDALRGLAAVAAGRTAEGLELLEDVSGRAEIETTHWRYFVLTLDTLGRVLAGQGEQAVPSAVRSLVAANEASMFWCVGYAIDAASLLAARLGLRALAVDALTSLDRALAPHGGRPFSAAPTTVLYPLRRALLAEDEVAAQGASNRPGVLEMAERLRTELASHIRPPISASGSAQGGVEDGG